MLNRFTPALLAGLMGGVSALAPASWAQQTDAAQPRAQTMPLADAAEGAAPQAAGEPETPRQQWQLHQGVPVHTQLQTWAERGGWTLHWQPKVSWLVAGDVEFEGSFEQALTQVIEGLFFEGKPIRLVLWEGNRLAEVIPSDVR